MFNWLTTPTVFRRIFSGFLIIISLVLIVSLISFVQLSRFRQSTEEAIPASRLLGLFQQYTTTLSSLDSDIERYLVIGGAEIRNIVEEGATALNQVYSEIELAAPNSILIDLTELENATNGLVTSSLELLNGEDVDSRQRNNQILDTFDAVAHAEDVLTQSVQAMLTQLENTIDSQENIVTSVLAQQIILAVVTIMVALIGSIIITRSIVSPITLITSATTEIAHGDYSQRVNSDSQNEIGKLAQSINQMASSIQERETELATINETLEQRVATRTNELKEARDEALAAKRIADENSRLKSEFLSMMSHELRTPMNAIEGFTGIMLQRMAGVDYNDRAERYIKKVQSNSRRLLGLINDFLDLSRIESGRLELANAAMSPTEMAQTWHDNLSVLADNKNLKFEVYVDPNLPETIYGDEESLSKIAINLVGNAIKFTDEGLVSLKLEKHDQQMKLEVTDTGMGIPPHAKEFIFDEFRQVDMTSKRQHGGTGLGLAIVNKLAIAMGGSVTLQSEVGVGSTFTVLLPIHADVSVLQGAI